MTPEALRDAARGGVWTSRWFPVDQSMIDAFADLTLDDQFIHVDPVRAAQSPFGTTIAHGFLTLSMLSAMAIDAQPDLEGTTHAVNYGFDRIRFLSPVPSGARIRGVFTLPQIDEARPGEITLNWDVSVEIDGAEKPALVARWIQRRYLEVS